MIEKPTVLILGAGASKPYDYPLGSELKSDIIKSLKIMLETNTGWVTELGCDNDLIWDFISKFSASPRTSIDSFLNYQKKEFEKIGKIAIVDAISKCEDKNKFYPKNDDWYTYLANFLFDCSFDDISNNKIGIITYNYDRSLEFFLNYSLLASYDECDNPEECIAKLKEIPVVH